MGDFIITAPDGKRYNVTGESHEDALASLRKMLGGGQPQQMPSEKLIATTKDGGRVVETANGLSFTSPGYSTTNQEQIARIMEGATPADESVSSFDRQTIAQHPVTARAQEFIQGTPLIGEWADEAVGMVSPKASAGMNALSNAMERENPIESAALNVLGSIATTAPVALYGGGQKVADFVNKATGPLTRALRVGAVSAGAGAVEGATSGAGRDTDNRLRGAGMGAGMGAGFGAILGPVADALGTGVTSLAKRIKKLDVSTIAEEFGLSPQAARVVKGYLVNDDMDAAAAYLARAGDDAMLAEAGPGTRQALDTAMSTGGGALSTARPRVDARVQGAATKWAQTLDDVLGTADGGIKGAAKDIAQGSAAARKAAYDFAFAQPTPMVGEAGERLTGVLSRIDPTDFQAAIREAAAEARDRGYRNFNIMASIGDDGTVTFTQPPSVMELDYLAIGLNNLVDAGTNKMTGQMTPAARRAAGQASALRDVLKENVKGYATALKLGGDKIKQTEALTMGRRLLSSTTTVEDVRNVMRNAPDGVRAAARKGLRENIEAVAGRARTTIADLEAGNLDFDTGRNQVAEAVTALRDLTKPENLQKLRFVVGSDADKLVKELQGFGDALVLRAAVARGSATAIRTSGQEAMRAEVAPGLLRRTAGNMGNPLDAAREVTQTIAGIDARSLSEFERRYFAEIADALTRIKGPEAARALSVVRGAMAGQPIKDADAQLIGRAVTVGGFELLQSLPQSQASR